MSPRSDDRVFDRWDGDNSLLGLSHFLCTPFMKSENHDLHAPPAASSGSDDIRLLVSQALSAQRAKAKKARGEEGAAAAAAAEERQNVIKEKKKNRYHHNKTDGGVLMCVVCASSSSSAPPPPPIWPLSADASQWDHFCGEAFMNPATMKQLGTARVCHIMMIIPYRFTSHVSIRYVLVQRFLFARIYSYSMLKTRRTEQWCL